jgi:branched-chain amino acid transport system permease protein
MFQKLIRFWAMHEKQFAAGFAVLALIFPFVVKSPYIVNIGVLSLMYVVLSLSLNLMTGYLGITTLGHAAFFGIGAYTAAILSTRFGFNFLLTSISAAFVTALFGLLLGAPTLRISGRYLTIVTIGFCEIARIVELNWMKVTRGPLGISRIPPPIIFGVEFDTPFRKYFIVLVMVAITIVLLNRLMNSRMGRAISAIKEDGLAADVMGVNQTHIKLMVFVISASIAGVAGGFFAHYMSFIDPTSFTFDRSVQILSMTILGGMGSIPGSVIGAIVLTAIPEILRELMEFRLIIYGLVIVLMVIFKPSGLLGGFNLRHIRERTLFLGEEGGHDE